MRVATVAIIVFILSACSGTKHLPPGESLYVGTRGISLQKTPPDGWTIKQSFLKKAGAYWAIWDLPNGDIAGFPSFRFIPFRLILYNWFYTEKPKGFSHWMMNNFGEPPVLLSAINPDLKTEKIVNIFENYGHFGTTGTNTVTYNRNRKKASVRYHVKIPKPYNYRTVEHITDSLHAPLTELTKRYHYSSVLQPGNEFNLDSIRAEKTKLWNTLQNSGFFFLQKDHILVQADTTVGNKQIDIRVRLDQDLPDAYFTKQSIGKTAIAIDTVHQDGKAPYYDWYNGRLRRHILDSLITVKSGQSYSLSKVRRTMRNINELGLFANPQYAFTVGSTDSTVLNANLSMHTLEETSVTFNAKGAYRATGYLGPALGLNLTQLNLFGGGENLSTDLDGYYYYPVGVSKEKISPSSGFSLRSTLSAPLLRPPFRFIKSTYATPRKHFTLGAEFNKREDYFTMNSITLGYSMSWRSGPKVTHRLSPIEVTFSDISNTTSLYDSLVAENPSLANSLVDQFVLGSYYSFKYDNLSLRNKRLGTYFEGKLEFAGNSLYLVSLLDNKDRDGVFGLDFSQFVELSYEFRTHFKLSNRSVLAFRHVAGFGYAYGNSSQLPYIRQFFIGGSNSLRPISARTAGPGRYIELQQGEVNQVGDIKLEFNLEYRFNFNARLSGALFTDAGNIWLLRPDPYRPNGEIRWGKLAQDSYLTAGVGLRLDVTFLVIRADYGAILYAPFFIDGKRWLWQNQLSLWGPVFGFGLPF
ncbi:BamA/TamA family outer membrane protein [Chryseolinea sp. T2]|uniref:translocation and assembly module lipoprotein TamL n=1 Tax=Chryseolinea sp. T2 TaxID=3129255 RepID=UPI003077DB1A